LLIAIKQDVDARDKRGHDGDKDFRYISPQEA
jgi:hypothetical protein